MDVRKFAEFAGGSIDQYTPPKNFELVGQKLTFEMDDGFETVLSFTGKNTLEWSIAGGKVTTEESYECLKGDPTTYLVTYELGGVTPRVCHTFVIDTENMLVTRVIAEIGKNPQYPYLMTTDFEFGAIKQEGVETKIYPRHGRTSDLDGNIMEWTYGPTLTTVHVYYCSNFYRITYPTSRVQKEGEEFNSAMTELLKTLPSSDEPAVYIKIKDGLYLTSITEINGEKLVGEKMGYRSDTLCFLQNYNRFYAVGRGFGTMTTDGDERPIFVTLGAYGRFVEPTEERFKKLLTDPNPYLT